MDVGKCCDIAEMIIGPTTSALKEAFREQLLAKSTTIVEEETIMRYFVTPGAEFKEALAMKAAVSASGGCYVVPDIVFLATLCTEHIRCERALSDELPTIFKVPSVAFKR